MKQGEKDRASEVIEKRLYTLASQLQNCLIQLMDMEIDEDAGRALKICGIYRKTEELFGCCGGGMSAGFLAELYLRTGNPKKAMESLERFVDVIIGTVQMPNPLLFSSAVKWKEGQEASTREMRQMFLKIMAEDESLSALRESEKYREDYQAAMEKLKAFI